MFQIVENALSGCNVFADGFPLRRRRFLAHLGIAILAQKLAFEKSEARGPAGRGRREVNREPQMLRRVVGAGEDLCGFAR